MTIREAIDEVLKDREWHLSDEVIKASRHAVTPEYAAKVAKNDDIASADLAAVVRRGTDRAINNELARLVYARVVEGQGRFPNRQYRKVAELLTSYRKQKNGVTNGNGIEKP